MVLDEPAVDAHALVAVTGGLEVEGTAVDGHVVVTLDTGAGTGRLVAGCLAATAHGAADVAARDVQIAFTLEGLAGRTIDVVGDGATSDFHIIVALEVPSL